MSAEEEAQRLAALVLPHWGGATGAPRLVKWRENAVFEVRLVSGRRAALRLHRPGYQTRTAVEGELAWMAALGRSGVPVPEVVRTVGGALTALAGSRVASMVGWLEGEATGAAERRLAGTAADQAALMADVGRLIARMHNATDALDLSGVRERPHWDAEGFLGDRPNWGPFWANPAFRADEIALIEAARSKARGGLGDWRRAGGDFGLIHADCLRENILRTPQGLALIDFDDSGHGFRLYDLATAVFQSLEEPALPEIVAGLVAGYREARGLSAEAVALLPLFVMLRTFASAGWITTRAAADDLWHRLYAGRAVRMAGHFLAGTAPWGDDGRA